MNKEKQIQILLCDGCTKYEAVKAIEGWGVVEDGKKKYYIEYVL